MGYTWHMTNATLLATLRLGVVLSVVAAGLAAGLSLIGEVSQWSLVIAVAAASFVLSWIQVGRVERGAVVEPHALAQPDGPGEPVVADLRFGRGQRRHQVGQRLVVRGRRTKEPLVQRRDAGGPVPGDRVELAQRRGVGQHDPVADAPAAAATTLPAVTSGGRHRASRRGQGHCKAHTGDGVERSQVRLLPTGDTCPVGHLVRPSVETECVAAVTEEPMDVNGWT